MWTTACSILAEITGVDSIERTRGRRQWEVPTGSPVRSTRRRHFAGEQMATKIFRVVFARGLFNATSTRHTVGNLDGLNGSTTLTLWTRKSLCEQRVKCLPQSVYSSRTRKPSFDYKHCCTCHPTLDTTSTLSYRVIRGAQWPVPRPMSGTHRSLASASSNCGPASSSDPCCIECFGLSYCDVLNGYKVRLRFAATGCQRSKAICAHTPDSRGLPERAVEAARYWRCRGTKNRVRRCASDYCNNRLLFSSGLMNDKEKQPMD